MKILSTIQAVSPSWPDSFLWIFFRARLTPVVTEEKNFLPSADDIKEEALKKELDTLDTESSLPSGDSSPMESVGGAAGLRNMLDGGERERRSSSEEWEKVNSEDIVDRNTSECWGYRQKMRIFGKL
jgi:hypothetical protein